MKKSIAALLLSLCAGAVMAQGGPDRKDILVEIINGAIVVKEETAITTTKEGALVWRIVQPGFKFPASGIVIDSKGKHSCAMHGDGKRFRCAKLGHNKGAKYKYTIKITDAGGKPLAPLDPYILDN